MNSCSEWQERVALYAGADLSPADCAHVERHLSNCPACRDFADGLRADLAALRDQHLEPIAAAHYAALRARVMGRVRGERPAFPQWKLGWAAALACAAGVFLLLLPRTGTHPVAAIRQNPPGSPVEMAAGPTTPPQPFIKPHRPHHARRSVRSAVARVAPQPEPAVAAQPLVVKLLTSDPNIVIYWITDPKGELP